MVIIYVRASFLVRGRPAIGRGNEQLIRLNEHFLPSIGVSWYRIKMGTEKMALMTHATATSSRARLPNDKNIR
jgi:hypothetical protein